MRLLSIILVIIVLFAAYDALVWAANFDIRTFTPDPRLGALLAFNAFACYVLSYRKARHV